MAHRKYHSIVWVRFQEPAGSSFPLLVLQDGSISYEAYKFLTDPLENQEKSYAWHSKAIHYIGALYDFYAAWYKGRPLTEETCREFFGKFINALMYGSRQTDGEDPSGLFWQPWPWSKVTHAVSVLREFSAFCVDYFDHVEFAPPAASWAVNVARAYSEEARRRRSILFHLKKRPRAANRQNEDASQRRRSLATGEPRAKTFPANKVLPLIIEGCRRSRITPDCRSVHARHFNVQLQLALVLLAGGGLRMSELFNLFLDDITGREVRLYHPEQGAARWKAQDGRVRQATRADYLWERFRRFPRTRLGKIDKEFVGWKNMLLEYDAPDNYSVIHWLSPEFSDLFQFLHKVYIQEVRPNTEHHPYYFVSLDRDNFGDPWTPNAFRQAFNAALQRIGLKPDRSLGQIPHGLRHGYGQALTDMRVPAQIIQYAMHHRSIESQLIYTKPSPEKVDQALRRAEIAIGLASVGRQQA